MAVHPEQVALMCLSAALVVPPGSDAGWGVGFDSQTAQAELADFLLGELLDDESPHYTPLGDLVIRLHKELGKAGGVLAMSMLTTLGAVVAPDDISSIFESFQSLLVACGTAPVDSGVQCIAGIDPYSILGMFIRRACAMFKNDTCEGHAALVRAMHGSMRAAIQRLSAAAEDEMRRSQEWATDPAAIEGMGRLSDGIARTCALARSAAERTRRALEEVDQELSSIGGAAPAAGDGGAAAAAAGRLALRGEDQLGLYMLRRLEEVQGRPSGPRQHPGEPRGTSALSPGSKAGPEAGGISVGGVGGGMDVTGGEKAASRRLRGADLDMPQLRYLELVEAIKSRDATACVDALHRYFDYGGGAAGAAANAAAAAAAAAAGGEAAKGRCQAALLSLSAAHASLGHTAESQRALQEALRLAQQQGDSWATVHSLAALCRLLLLTEGVSDPDCSGTTGAGAAEGAAEPASGLDLGAVKEQQESLELLRRCLKISCKQPCPHIAAFASVAVARFCLQHASAPPQQHQHSQSGPADPAGGAAAAAVATAAAGNAAPACVGALHVQAALRDACTLHHAAALAAAAPHGPAAAAGGSGGVGAPHHPRVGELYNPSGVFGPDTRGSLRASARACLDVAGAGHLLQAAAWHQYGAPGLAVAHALVYLTCYGGLDGGGAGPGSESGSGGGGAGCQGAGGKDAASAWAQLVALALEQQGPDAADEVLSVASTPFPLELPKQLAAVRADMMHRRAVRERNAAEAELWLSELISSADPGSGLDRETKLTAALRRAEMLAEGGALAAAHDAAAAAFQDASRSGMQSAATSALLLLADIHMSAGDPSGALPYALSASLQCQQLHLSSLAPRAALLVARLWHALAPSGAGRALSMLRAVLPLALAQRDLEAVGKLRVAMAEVVLSEASDVSRKSQSDQVQASSGSDGSSDAAGQAAEWLALGANDLEGAGAWKAAQHAWSLLAVLMHARQDLEARDSAAARAAAAKHE